MTDGNKLRLMIRIMIGFGFAYLLGAFVSWQGNPVHWPPEGRGVVAGIGFIVTIALFTVKD